MNWTIQQIINVAFLIAIGLLFWSVNQQGLILTEVESRVNVVEHTPPKTELEVCADALEGTANPMNNGTFDRTQAIIMCRSMN